jgi:hypothetical protein
VRERQSLAGRCQQGTRLSLFQASSLEALRVAIGPLGPTLPCRGTGGTSHMSVRRSLHTGLRQAFAVLLPARTMGVMSDGRAYGQACVLRAVTFTDGVTADYHPFASFTAISPPTVTIPTLSYLTELAFFISQSDGWSAPATNPVEVGLSYRPSRCYVARSLSEDYLLSLAERTFLKLWAVPNSFYASGKELTDLIVPFGDDVIIISDKACRFDFKKSLNVAWGRWYRSGIEDSLRQLKTAMRQVRRAPDSIFTDARASIPLPWSVAPGGKPRFHLVAIARPDSSPGVIPPEWPGLRYVANAHGEPFKIGKLEVGGSRFMSSMVRRLTCCLSRSTLRPISSPI